MAISNFQTPNKITFYPSYLQYAYAMGYIEDVESSNENITKEELYKLISLDPSIVSEFELEKDDWIKIKFNTDNNGINLDFGMYLGHNNYESNSVYNPIEFTNEDEYDQISSTGVVNISNGGYTYANGWSLFNISHFMNGEGIGFRQSQLSSNIEAGNKLGCFVLGKKWEAPQNIDVGNSFELNWGINQKKTTSGKTISNVNYYKPNKWLLDAWELSEELADTRGIATESRNGVRSWKVKWSFLQEKYVYNQNYMTNDENWNVDEDNNYTTYGDNNSLYNTKNSIDFTTSVLKYTLGNHLPIIVNISDSKNSDQWAIVRIKRHSIRQKNPHLIDISLTLEEQI